MDQWPGVSPYGTKTPSIHPDAYVDPSARIIGDVHLAKDCSISPMAVLRADSETARVGRRAAVLDLALLEAPTDHPVVIDDEALVSHGAIIHGAHVHCRALVGIGAIVLEGAVVSTGAIIGAGSVITPGSVIPPDSLVLGTPGRVVRKTTERERSQILGQIEDLYKKSQRLKAQEHPVNRAPLKRNGRPHGRET